MLWFSIARLFFMPSCDNVMRSVGTDAYVNSNEVGRIIQYTVYRLVFQTTNLDAIS